MKRRQPNKTPAYSLFVLFLMASAVVMAGERGNGPLKGVMLRTPIATREGGLAVWDAPKVEGADSGDSTGFLVYWHGAGADEVHVYGRIVRTRADLLHALRWLKRDVGVTVEALAERLFVDLPQLLLAESDSEPILNGRMWLPATRDRVMEIAGLWSPEDFDPAVPPVVVARVGDPCRSCVVAGATLDPLVAAKLDPYEAGVMTACECCELPPCPNCADNSACTVDYCNRVCEVVWCVNRRINCNDDSPCTIDGCNPQSGCYHTPKDCDDGDICTWDRCMEGTCDHTPHCGDRTCCPTDDWLFCCDEGEDQCCPKNPNYANHCCETDETCCGNGCCPPDQTCCNNACGLKGACCFFDTGSCSELTGLCCQQQGGTYQGDGTTCSPGDLCRPKCENCHNVAGVFFECGHYTPDPNEPCDQYACIQNTVDTNTCDSFPYRLGTPQCNTSPVASYQQEIFQVIYDLPLPTCETSNPGDYYVWQPIYYGCSGSCYPDPPIRFRCDTGPCGGQLRQVPPVPRGWKKKCGCP